MEILMYTQASFYRGATMSSAESAQAEPTGRPSRTAKTNAVLAWKYTEEKEEPAKKKKKVKKDEGIRPKGHTDLPHIRRLRSKYTEEQLAWCARRFPVGLLELGWEAS